MPKSQTKKSTQRKLGFAAVETSAEQLGYDDDEVVVVVDEDDHDEQQQVREPSSRKRSAPSRPSRGEKSQRTISKLTSTPKKGTATAPIVTPAGEEATSKKSSTQVHAIKKEYVPTYIHKNLEYHRKGEASDALPSKTLKVFQLITDHYAIPRDLEQSRSYGPLSGSTYEERVISAYRLGKLKASNKPATIICTGCAEIGHERDECPTLL